MIIDIAQIKFMSWSESDEQLVQMILNDGRTIVEFWDELLFSWGKGNVKIIEERAEMIRLMDNINTRLLNSKG